MMTEFLWLLFVSSAALQLLYLSVIFGRLGYFYRPATLAAPPDNMGEGVSIIIAAHNEKENLKKLLPLLFEQAYSPLEVLVVNDRSTDGTRFLLEKLMRQYPRLRTVTVEYTPKHVTPKKYALTLGIKVAKYDVLLLTDADCLPASPNWVRRMTYPIRHEEKTFALGHGAYTRQKGFLNTLIRYETWFTAIQYFSFALWKAPFMGVGRNLAYRKSFFMEQKAFRGLWQVLGGDDDLFVNRYARSKNTAVVIHPESITFSVPKNTFKSYFLQKKRHYQAGKYYKSKDKFKLGLYAVSHLVFWVSGLILLSIYRNWEPITLVIGIISIRALLQYTLFSSAKRKLEGGKKVFWTMFFDLMYLSYFWIIGTKGYLAKTVRWK